MTKEEETADIWLPPEAMDPNVARMSWALFVKSWEAVEMNPKTRPAQKFTSWVRLTYKDCVEAATIINEAQSPKGEQPL